jgi:hypothetical protein
MLRLVIQYSSAKILYQQIHLPWIIGALSLRKKLYRYLGINADKLAYANAAKEKVISNLDG